MKEPDLFSDIPDDPVTDNEAEMEKDSQARCIRIKELSKTLKNIYNEKIPYTAKHVQSAE